MTGTRIGRPKPDEYDGYYAGYVERARSRSVRAALTQQQQEVTALLGALGEEGAAFRYAPGKWSVKQVIGHVIDTERIFVYRALSIARGERQPLPSFDQDEYVEAADFDSRSVDSLLSEYRATRAATLELFAGFAAAAWETRGIANGVVFSVRAIAHIVAGHEAHHLEVLRERYLDRE